MRNLTLALLLSGAAVMASAPAQAAPHGHKFLVFKDGPQVNNPQRTAAAIEASLTRDPTGKSIIDANSCAQYRACAKPEDYIDPLHHADPGANITDVSQLPAYFRSLVARAAPEGEFFMSCLIGNADEHDMPKWDCNSRHFHINKGETVFVNPVTGAVVVARDCDNIIGKLVELNDCVEYHVYLKVGDEIHTTWMGPEDMPTGKCKVMIKKTGQEAHWAPALDECPRDTCDFSGPSRYYGFKVWDTVRISWKAKVEGDNVIRLPREVTMMPLHKTRIGVLLSSGLDSCVIHADGSQTKNELIYASSYRFDKSLVTYDGHNPLASSGWTGLPHIWKSATTGKPE